ncbi:hypothetical protein GE09DRAFT_1276764 [Coniochaeta sp. 2T2.1]|nr:hypothetical protein GE09DRAFT_1276764 [Coniochaeta sp. 2T2.1]
MRWKTSFRAGRGRRDGLGDARGEHSLHIRQDDPTVPDLVTDDDDNIDDGPDTDTEDDDDAASPTGAPPPPPPPPNAPPSPTRSIPTLTPIFHTSAPFTTSTTGRGVKTIPPPQDETFSTVTTSSSRKSAATSTSVGITTATTIGAGLIASATGTGQTSALSVMRPEESDPPLVGSPSSRSGLSAGAKAGIAIGVISAVALLATLAFVLFKRRARRDNNSAPAMPPDHNHNHNHNQPGGTRTQSQIIADMVASANAMQNGGIPSPYHPDEKSPISPLAGGEQPQIRTSIASWLRRHHPLNLNPQDGRASTASASKTPSLASVPKTPTTGSPRTTTISLDSPERKSKPADKDKGKFISVWSNSTPSTASEGNRNTVSSSESGDGGGTAILSMYGKGFDSIRGTWVLPPRPRDSVTPSQSVSQRGSRVG